MSTTEEDFNAFPLPFQWDDGEHFAPVVFTKEEELDSIRQIILLGRPAEGGDNNKTSSSSKTQHHQKHFSIQPLQNGERIIDAGCGNGRVPFYIASQIYSVQKEKKKDTAAEDKDKEEEKQVSSPLPKDIQILGVDIEQELISKAKSEATTALGLKPEQLDFIHKDLRESIELLSSCHFIYCYLLPGDLLTELMMKVTEHWRQKKSGDDEEKESKQQQKEVCRVIISNTWEISCLKEFLVGKSGDMWVYSSRR